MRKAPHFVVAVQALSAPGRPAPGTKVFLTDTHYRAFADSTGRIVFDELLPGPFARQVVDSRAAKLGLTLPTLVRFVATTGEQNILPFVLPTLGEEISRPSRRCGLPSRTNSPWREYWWVTTNEGNGAPTAGVPMASPLRTTTAMRKLKVALVSRVALLALAGAALSACQSAPSAQQPARPPAPAAALGHAVGDSTAYGGELRWVSDSRTEVAYKLTASARVVMLEVIPEKGIRPVLPEAITAGPMFEPGLHSAAVGGAVVSGASLDRQSTRLSATEEYERCMENARQTAPLSGGTEGARAAKGPTRFDSSGNVISGPTSLAANASSLDMRRAQERCRSQSQSSAARANATIASVPNRYLVFFASEIPVRAVDIKSLVVTEGDINSIVRAVGKKLYDAAPWSGYYLRW